MTPGCWQDPGCCCGAPGESPLRELHGSGKVSLKRREQGPIRLEEETGQQPDWAVASQTTEHLLREGETPMFPKESLNGDTNAPQVKVGLAVGPMCL